MGATSRSSLQLSGSRWVMATLLLPVLVAVRPGSGERSSVEDRAGEGKLVPSEPNPLLQTYDVHADLMNSTHLEEMQADLKRVRAQMDGITQRASQGRAHVQPAAQLEVSLDQSVRSKWAWPGSKSSALIADPLTANVTEAKPKSQVIAGPSAQSAPLPDAVKAAEVHPAGFRLAVVGSEQSGGPSTKKELHPNGQGISMVGSAEKDLVETSAKEVTVTKGLSSQAVQNAYAAVLGAGVATGSASSGPAQTDPGVGVEAMKESPATKQVVGAIAVADTEKIAVSAAAHFSAASDAAEANKAANQSFASYAEPLINLAKKVEDAGVASQKWYSDQLR